MASPTAAASVCCYCGVGCGVLVTPEKNGDISVVGNPDSPVNRGALCSKGLNLQYPVNDRRDRLLFPQMRHSKKPAAAARELGRCPGPHRRRIPHVY